jgi:hypothetical protein
MNFVGSHVQRRPRVGVNKPASVLETRVGRESLKSGWAGDLPGAGVEIEYEDRVVGRL